MVIALDIGTSSTRATVYDAQARPVPGRFHQVPHDPRTTADGGVEHDAALLLEAVGVCLDAVLAGPRLPKIEGVGVSTFWHGLVGFDAADRVSTPVFTWADSRSAEDAGLLRGALDEPAFHARTGCHLHASYWPAKLRWLTRAKPADTRRVARWGSVGELVELSLFGTGRTSISMASGTGLLNQDAVTWDGEAVAAAGIDERQLFPLTDRTDARRGMRASWAGRWPALRRAAWFPAVGDGAASNVGSDCTETDRIALNLGTSAALRVVTTRPGTPPPGLWRYRLDRRRSLLGGATSEGGNVWAWCQDVLRLPADEAVESAVAAASPDGHRLTVLPFLAGERSPGWRADRRGAIMGLSLDTTALQIVHAALESVALRLALVYELLAPHATAGHVVVGSGGALARSPAWTRMIADALGQVVTLFSETEATSRGVAKLTLEALGALPDLSAARAPLGQAFAPDPARHARFREALARQRLLAERV
jgi:gluconokinase